MGCGASTHPRDGRRGEPDQFRTSHKQSIVDEDDAFHNPGSLFALLRPLDVGRDSRRKGSSPGRRRSSAKGGVAPVKLLRSSWILERARCMRAAAIDGSLSVGGYRDKCDFPPGSLGWRQ